MAIYVKRLALDALLSMTFHDKFFVIRKYTDFLVSVP